MIIGQTVVMGSNNYYSPWFPRQGDSAVFSVQLFATGPSFAGSLNVFMETKNNDQADSAAGTATNGTFSMSGTTPGVFGTALVSSLSELVRFKFVPNGTTAGTYMHFRILPPAWEAN